MAALGNLGSKDIPYLRHDGPQRNTKLPKTTPEKELCSRMRISSSVSKTNPNPGSNRSTGRSTTITAEDVAGTTYAKSTDGIHWTKPILNQWEYEGSLVNNFINVGPVPLPWPDNSIENVV